ncbi:MAG: HlyD family efflux transporter periplasmic adaptor subunit [Bacteroidetes bacterium]|nr:HlyD family secretion protein [Rhodothermaceae bacterium RA]RMH66163.1 MAG: HlyD family efflux transporter periplasmic adaptor subunit [Bacteroidota bacterium]
METSRFEPGSAGAMLEPIQIDDLYHEDDVPLADVRTSALRLLVYAGVGLTALFVLLGSAIRIPRYYQEAFVLKGTQQEQVRQFSYPVFVQERYAEVGSVLEAGAPLVKINAPEVVRAVEAYETARQRRRLFESTEQAVYQAQIETLQLEEDRYREAIAAYEEQKRAGWRLFVQQRDKLTRLAEQARDRYERERQLVERQFISREQFREAEEARIVAEADLALLIEARRKEVADLDAQITQASLNAAIAARQRAEVEHEMQRLAQSYALEEEQARQALLRTYGPFEVAPDGLIVKAPAAGTLSFVAEVGRELPAGSLLYKTLPSATALYAQASISPQRIGFIDVDDPVILKVATFPHYEWGVVEGRIQALSVTPDTDGRYPFEVAITDAGRLAPYLSVGMTGELAVELERKSFFGYVFENVRRVYFSAVR